MQTNIKSLRVHQMTIGQFEAQFPDEDACRIYLAANRWPDGVTCPRCGNANVHEYRTREHHWNCYQCSADGVGYRFSVLVGTIFENTNKPLRDWFRVMHMMLTSKNGISALQVYRVMGFGSYNTALLICNKIRAALGGEDFKQLVGYVEIDETFVGGKAHNKHRGPGGPGGKGGMGHRGPHGKAIFVGAVKRKGNVIAAVGRGRFRTGEGQRTVGSDSPQVAKGGFSYMAGATQADAGLFKGDAAITKTKASNQWNSCQVNVARDDAQRSRRSPSRR